MAPQSSEPHTLGSVERLERAFELAMALGLGLASPVAGVVALLALGSVSMDVAQVGERLVRWNGAGAGGQRGQGAAPVVLLVSAPEQAAEPERVPVETAAADPLPAAEPCPVEPGSPGVEPGPVELGGQEEAPLAAVAPAGPVLDLLGSEQPGEGVPWGTVQHGTGRLVGGAGGGGGGATTPHVTTLESARSVATAGPPATHTVDAAGEMRFVAVPGGAFWMGSPEDEPGRFDNEGPRHRVHVAPYWLASTEVTRAQWRAVMGSTPPGGRHDDEPVVGVSWCDTLRYANELSQREGLTPAYRLLGPCAHGGTVTWDRSADGYRLPTEAEWELAARGGDEQLYAGGGALESVGWYLGNAEDGARSVAALAPNAYGLYDMSGNVWEWVWDRLGAYPAEAQHDPAGPERGETRILRGGSWRYEARYARVADRNWGHPGYRARAVGFRLARGLQPGDLDALVSEE